MRKGAEFGYWIHALSPLHVGAGRGEGYIDLPLARERTTNLPYIPGSSVKGVIADRCDATEEKRRQNTQPNYHRLAFGSAGEETSNSGMLVFTDARLICLPTPSLHGTFAWCACPMILRRLARDLDMAGWTKLPTIPEPAAAGVLVPEPVVSSALCQGGTVYLQDWDLKADGSPPAAEWAELIAGAVFPKTSPPSAGWSKEFCKRFAVISDDLFGFLCETGTEVQPHIKIDAEKKTAVGQAFWYEESLPSESILMGLVWRDGLPRADETDVAKVLAFCQNRDGGDALQFGGKGTVGKGRSRLLFAKCPSPPSGEAT